jgi:hypothetical protein
VAVRQPHRLGDGQAPGRRPETPSPVDPGHAPGGRVQDRRRCRVELTARGGLGHCDEHPQPVGRVAGVLGGEQMLDGLPRGDRGRADRGEDRLAPAGGARPVHDDDPAVGVGLGGDGVHRLSKCG